MNYLNADGKLIHEVTRGYEASSTTVLTKVRIDDRGDLCVYVWGLDDVDAMDEAIDYADESGWEFDEEDVTVWPLEDGEFDAVLAASVEDGE
jgi:hypothetical protein